MILFWALSVVLIFSAIWTISAKKPVYSVVALLLNFAALAFMYITLSAEFLAVIQIIVYSGAILVLFLFVIALLSSGVSAFAMGQNRLPKITIPAGVVALIALGFAVYAFSRASVVTQTTSRSMLGPVGTGSVFGSVADFGTALFRTQLLPFEITALILLVAVIGVVLLAGDAPAHDGTPGQVRKARKAVREAILRAGDR